MAGYGTVRILGAWLRRKDGGGDGAPVAAPGESRAPGSGADAGPPAALGGDARSRRRWRRRHTLVLLVVLLVVAVGVASEVQLPYYAVTPGQAIPVESLLGLPAGRLHRHPGEVMMVDVYLTPLRAIDYPWFALQSSAAILPAPEVLGPANAHQYQVEGELDMLDAQQAATVVALREVGYTVPYVPAGTLLYLVTSGSPAAQGLHTGDVVVALDGRPTTGPSALEAAIQRRRPGDPVRLTVLAYPGLRRTTVSLRLGEYHTEGPSSPLGYACLALGARTRAPVTEGRDGRPIPCLGVEVEPYYRLGRLPFPVRLDAEGIVGPSAGLAFTLGLIDALDPASLTGGLRVAATGTMSLDGSVGAVGGVAQKTVAVSDAGASVFLVPPEEYRTAVAHAGPHLRVFAVSSIGQAIAVLERLGGRLVRVPPARRPGP